MINNHDFKYLLKTDDDCIVDVPELMEYLQAVHTTETNEKLWIGK